VTVQNAPYWILEPEKNHLFGDPSFVWALVGRPAGPCFLGVVLRFLFRMGERRVCERGICSHHTRNMAFRVPSPARSSVDSFSCFLSYKFAWLCDSSETRFVRVVYFLAGANWYVVLILIKCSDLSPVIIFALIARDVACQNPCSHSVPSNWVCLQRRRVISSLSAYKNAGFCRRTFVSPILKAELFSVISTFFSCCKNCVARCIFFFGGGGAVA